MDRKWNVYGSYMERIWTVYPARFFMECGYRNSVVMQ